MTSISINKSFTRDTRKPNTSVLLDISSKAHPKTDPSRFVQTLLTTCDLYYSSKKNKRNIKKPMKSEIMKELSRIGIKLSENQLEVCLKLLSGKNIENKRYVDIQRPEMSVFSTINGKILTCGTMDEIFEPLMEELENLCKNEIIRKLIYKELLELKEYISLGAIVDAEKMYKSIIYKLEKNKYRGNLPKIETKSVARRFIPKDEAELIYLENIS
jgi:hypothetical protein